ncbi:unnamed protein product [Schistosoma margrebowiei]|uniref:DH domain-containing protein n=1 Tax=Schistosoma margrebowiei TaxID=48269 RepID=A0A3P8DN06_9TREM|nr:unnamed protein product [Schistosoma margrebowiei]
MSLATSATVNFLSLSDVFLKTRDNLLIYGEYCGHLQHAQNLVYEIMRNDVEKRNKIELCQSNSEKYNKFALAELLTIPIQRVLKYHLLLEVSFCVFDKLLFFLPLHSILFYCFYRFVFL